MKLNKAFEIVEEWDILSANEVDQDLRDALKLLMEAGKRIEATRLVRKIGPVVLLPGETEE